MVKVGIVGAGAVGVSCMSAMVLRGSAREIVLVNRNADRARGAVRDLQYAALLSPALSLRAGDYEDLHDSAIVVITAGANEKSGGATDRGDAAGRLRLVTTNADVYREIVPRIVAAAPEAILLVVTDPPDVLADIARQLAGHERILSSGTFLDSLRFRFHLARRLGVDARSVQAQVLGEHGTSQVFVWSSASIAGTPIVSGTLPGNFSNDIEDEVRYANIDIIEGTGASSLGIGVVAARIVEIVARDEKAVIPIGSHRPDLGVTLSLPSRLGRQGVDRVFAPSLSSDEAQALARSAETLRRAVAAATSHSVP